MQTVADWLTEIGLPQYAELFARNEVGFDVLADIVTKARSTSSSATASWRCSVRR
jgi:hypothetical protein